MVSVEVSYRNSLVKQSKNNKVDYYIYIVLLLKVIWGIQTIVFGNITLTF